MPRSSISVFKLAWRRPAAAGANRTSLPNRILIAGFLVALAVPMIGVTLGKAATLASENRRPASPPALNETFAKQFDAYYADRTGGRRALLRLRNRMLLDGFGESPAAAVLIGDGEWLFMNVGLDPLNRNGFTEPDVTGAAAALRKRAAWCEARGIRYVVQIARDKHRVHPQHLPPRIRKGLPADCVPDLVAACPGVTILDPLPDLLQEAATNDVFHRKDTHWNATGALVAYLQLARHLERTQPGYRGKPRAAFVAEHDTHPVGDLALMAGLPARLWSEPRVRWHPPREAVTDHPGADVEAMAGAMRLSYLPAKVRTSPAKNNLHILLLHDSFGPDLRDHLSGDVSRLTAVGAYGLPTALVEAMRPDVVVQQFVERILCRNQHAFDAD